MLKKTIITLLALVFAVLLVAPSTANAQVVVGVGVGRVYPRPYGYAAVSPGPYVVAPAPYGAGSSWRSVVSKALCLSLPWICGPAWVRVAAVRVSIGIPHLDQPPACLSVTRSLVPLGQSD